MSKKQQGFTIIELLIATTVFSVVMVLCLTAFLRVGQLYYKGIYLSRTQEAARDISDDIIGQLRLNGNPGGGGLQAGGTIGPYNVYFMCAGNKRYSFMSNNVVDSQTESPSKFGLIRDNMPAGNNCVSPTVIAPVNPIELLGDKMRVVATNPNQSDISDNCNTVSSNTICSVHVHVDFGDNELLVNPAAAAPNNTFASAVNVVSGGNCSGPLQGSQFCATSDIDTTIYPQQ